MQIALRLEDADARNARRARVAAELQEVDEKVKAGEAFEQETLSWREWEDRGSCACTL